MTPNSLYWEPTLDYAAVHSHYCTSKTTTVRCIELKLRNYPLIFLQDGERCGKDVCVVNVVIVLILAGSHTKSLGRLF